MASEPTHKAVNCDCPTTKILREEIRKLRTKLEKEEKARAEAELQRDAMRSVLMIYQHHGREPYG